MSWFRWALASDSARAMRQDAVVERRSFLSQGPTGERHSNEVMK